ncbi:MAG: hypothetical protein RBS07_04220 [Lentimicrobium sp.]|jgi:hypothetical protein|nr:hypothetical protein [Lentimicrobium sp.]
MKNLTRLLFSATLLASLLLFNACEKDDPQSDNNQPVLNVGVDIVGMTEVSYPMNVNVTDPDGDELILTWKLIDSPVGSAPVIAEISTTSASFTTNIAGLYKVEVTASDGQGKTATGIITLYIGGLLPNRIDNNTTYPDLFENEDYPDYYAAALVTITAGLTLEPGVVIENAADVRLWFSGNNAFLDARGTAAKNIIFRGMDKVKGSWKAIHIASNNVNNKLDYVQILHAGSSEISNEKSALILQSNTNTRASITNTHISESGGYGLYIDGDNGNLTAFANNNFSDNESAPIRFGAENMYVLDKNSVYQNNGIQAIEIASGGNTNVVFNTPGTVPYAGLRYHVYSSFEVRAEVTFASGVTCLFDQGKRLWVTSDGAIIANAVTDPISFMGMVDGQGTWFGMEIASPSPLNLLNGVYISNGGDSGGRGANIYLFGSSPGSNLTITNSEISDSETWGIWATSGSVVLNESNNTFSNNASGNVRID